MTPDRAALWEAIRTFDIDGEPRALTFAARLARENGWTVGFAERVVLEYKRFVFLAVTGTSQVTPSDQVDQAWHLHLTYTRSYWERFCAGVLPKPLHHEPTKGGADEGARFDAQYRATLSRYAEEFGAPPPADVWPAPEQRFGDDLHFVRVNARRNRVVPRRAGGWFRALLPLVALLLCAAEWKPQPSTPEMIEREARDRQCVALAFGASALVVPFLFFGLRVRRNFRRTPPGADAFPLPALTVHDVAYLEGGWQRAAEVAVARLVREGHLRYDADLRRLHAAEPLGAPQHPTEAVVYAAVAERASGATVRDVTDAARANGDGGFEPLVAAGVAHSPAGALAAWLWGSATVLSFATVLLGGALAVCALLKSGPGFVFGTLWLIAWWVSVILSFRARRWRTHRGDECVNVWRAEAEAVGTHRTDLPIAIALEGPASAAVLVAVAVPLCAFFTLPPAPLPGAPGDGSSGGGCGGGCGGCGGCGG